MPRKTKTLTGVVFDRGGNPESETSKTALPPLESSDDLRAALGLPCDALICRMLIDSFESWQGYGYPDYWQDYIYELVGVPPGPTSPPEVPRITWRDAMSSDRVPVIALRRRVYCKRTPLYVEARWHPTKGEAISLHGLEKDTRKKSVNRAYLGITLLKVIEAAGRGRQEKPEGFDSYEDAISGMVGVVRVLKRKGQRYRQEDVAEYLLTKTTRFQRTSATQSDDVAHKARLLRKYCQHEGLRWADIVRLACNS